MPRFVVLRHETPPDAARGSHWDLMLEVGDVLRTWACSRLPRSDCTVDAWQLADHRHAYLDYEGPVSGGRGAVTRWDAGTYVLLEERPRRWSVRLRGKRLAGRLTLTRADEATGRWQVHWTVDAPS